MKENNIFLPDLLVIPTILIRDKNLTPLDHQVYGVVYWYTKLKNERCTASNTTLAGIIKANPDAVGNSLNRLEKGGYIQRIFSDKKKRHRIEIIPLIIFTKIAVQSDNGTVVQSDNGTGPINRLDDVQSIDGQNKNIDNKKKKKKGFAVEYTPDFEQFWSAYPKKEGKVDCFGIWQTLELKEYLPEILTFLSGYKQSDRVKAGYVKNPSTFLNNRCWEDDIKAYNSGTGPKSGVQQKNYDLNYKGKEWGLNK